MTPKADIISAERCQIARIAEIENTCISDGWSEKALMDCLDEPSAMMFSAVIDGETVGFLNGSYVLDEGELLNIAVVEEYRGLGIAGDLLERFEKELEKKDVESIFLEVREGNAPARNFYEKHGYTQNGLRKRYYRSPNENAVLMVKKLKR